MNFSPAAEISSCVEFSFMKADSSEHSVESNTVITVFFPILYKEQFSSQPDIACAGIKCMS